MTRVNTTQQNTSFITQLPPEVFLSILLYVDVYEILSLRKTCRQLNELTRERPTWIHLLHIYQAFLPIPHDVHETYHQHDTLLSSYSSASLEEIVRYAKSTAYIWTKPRQPPFRLHHAASPIVKPPGQILAPDSIRSSRGFTLLGMQLFLDRWLLVVYSDGLANLYDVGFSNDLQTPKGAYSSSRNGSPPPSAQRKTLRAQLDGQAWNSFAAGYDDPNRRIVFIVARTSPVNIIEIYSVSLSVLTQTSPMGLFIPNSFQQIGYKTLSAQRSIRHIDTTQRVVILSSSNKIEVLQWQLLPYDGGDVMWGTVQRSDHIEAQTLSEDLEELWNGVLGVRLLGHYVVVFRTRSLEIYHYKFRKCHNQDDHALDNEQGRKKLHIQLKHAFPLTFRDVTFSETATSWIAASNSDLYELKLLAYDVMQGLFQYVVKLLVPRANIIPDAGSTSRHLEALHPSLDVILLGVYPLSFGGKLKHNKRTSLISSFSSSPATDSPSSGTSTPTPTTSHSHSFIPTSSTAAFGPRGADGNARGFISAHCMGPQGKRAVWVERKRSSTVREVQVWAMDPPAPLVESDLDDGSPHLAGDEDDLPLEFENQVVYTANSYDLRDDIVLCTFSELHGTIILGHRSGEVSVLDLA